MVELQVELLPLPCPKGLSHTPSLNSFSLDLEARADIVWSILLYEYRLRHTTKDGNRPAPLVLGQSTSVLIRSLPSLEMEAEKFKFPASLGNLAILYRKIKFKTGLGCSSVVEDLPNMY